MAEKFKPENYIAAYAAALSTILAAVQLWQFCRSGVRLKLSVITDGVLVGTDGNDEKDLIVLTVINRGTAPTRITNMIVVVRRRSWRKLWRLTTEKAFVVLNPQPLNYPPIVPSDLQPSRNWIGCVRRREDLMPDICSGKYYVGIQTTHRDQPYLVRVRGKDRGITTRSKGERLTKRAGK
jgi:hypothetical protein